PSEKSRPLQRHHPDERPGDEVVRHVEDLLLHEFLAPNTLGQHADHRVVRASANDVAFPPPVTSSRSRMNSSARVDGRDLTGLYRTRSSVHGSGWPWLASSRLNRGCRFRCRALVPPCPCEFR